jgi:uncharacterized membrane protein YphA (DoxX/SURF4 family)
MQILSIDPAKARATLRRGALVVLWVAAIAQVIWMSFHHFRLHESWGSMWYPLTLAMPFLLLVLTEGRVRWVASLLRVPLAFAFLDAVADRLGLLGAAGAPGVAWGDFRHFIEYTAQVNSFLPSGLIPALAVLATICETTFGVGLLFGVGIPYMAMGSAGLLFLFGTAMTVSGSSQFAYGVYLLAAGALTLSTVDASLVSVDALLRRSERRIEGFGRS